MFADFSQAHICICLGKKQQQNLVMETKRLIICFQEPEAHK